jgi:hypothetical protein
MGISLDNLEKIELTGTTSSSIDQADILTAILRVKQPDYVPTGVTLRARIDENMFTGSFKAEDLKDIESDENVLSIAISRRLHRID